MPRYNPTFPVGATRRVPRGPDVYGVQPPAPPAPPPVSPEQQTAIKFDYQRMLMELQEKIRRQQAEEKWRLRQAESDYNLRVYGAATQPIAGPYAGNIVPNV